MSGPHIETPGDAAERRVLDARRIVLNLTRPGSEGWIAPGLPLTDELSTILEELEVTLEELRQRNEELAQAQHGLETSRARYKELFDSAPVAYLDTDRFGRIDEANRIAAELLGTPQDRLAGKPLSIFVVDEDRRLFRQRLAIATGGTSVRGIELRIEPRHRPPFIGGLEISPVKNESGDVTGLRWLIRDLTESKLEASLFREGEARLVLMLGQIPAIIWTTDAECRITGVQGSGLAEAGLDRSRVVGTSLSAFLGSDDPENPALVAHHRALRGEHVSFETDWRGRPYRVGVEPLFAGDGTINGCVGVALDLTEDVHIRSALESALEREMKTSSQLEEINEMKDLLMRTLSHDLRGPLTSVLGYAATLDRLQNIETTQARGMIHRIAGNAHKMERMVQDLLDLDRLDKRILQPQRVETDLDELAGRVIAAMDTGAHPITVEAEGRADVDDFKVERILENLIGDCLKHTPRDTAVWVRLSPVAGGGAHIVVEDNGPGIPDDLKPRAFQPFVRGPSTASGMGIGLTIVARFAELHGGRAWIEDRPGGGASFQVELPGPAR